MDRTRQRRKMHIAGLLAFLLLATAMLSLRLFDGGAASGTVNVGGMFTYETGFSAGARAATAANGTAGVSHRRQHADVSRLVARGIVLVRERRRIRYFE